MSKLYSMRIFPFYPQYDMMDCGSACLRMIAKWYGAEYSIQTLREMSYTNREGVSLNGIKVAAESMGFRAYGIRITIEVFASRFISTTCVLNGRKVSTWIL